MLINTTENPVQIPGNNLYQKFKYILLNPSSSQIGKVSISCIFYADDQSFFDGQTCGDCFLGNIDFDINQAGLLEATENYAMTQFPSFERCAPPIPPMSPEESEE